MTDNIIGKRVRAKFFTHIDVCGEVIRIGGLEPYLAYHVRVDEKDREQFAVPRPDGVFPFHRDELEVLDENR